MKIDLKKFRQAHDLFQSDISAILGVNQSNVSRAEIKGCFELSYEQEKKLFDKFGEKEVKAFCIPQKPCEKYSVVASGNANTGDGTQNNGIFAVDATTMNIIKQQSEALTNLAEKQISQNERLIVLLEKLSEKL